MEFALGLVLGTAYWARRLAVQPYQPLNIPQIDALGAPRAELRIIRQRVPV